MNYASEIAKQLLQIKAIKLNPQKPFRWASGRFSPIYCDNRMVLSYPDTRNLVLDGFENLAKLFGQIDGIAGVATAGIPHGALLADRLGVPFIYVRSASKSHGRQNQIEGEIRPGQRVLVIEDLISTGGSCLKAVDALKDAGIEPVAVLAIFTYQLPAATKAFAQAELDFKTLTDYSTLLERANTDQLIQAADLETLKNWRHDPIAWSEQFS